MWCFVTFIKLGPHILVQSKLWNQIFTIFVHIKIEKWKPAQSKYILGDGNPGSIKKYHSQQISRFHAFPTYFLILKAMVMPIGLPNYFDIVSSVTQTNN